MRDRNTAGQFDRHYLPQTARDAPATTRRRVLGAVCRARRPARRQLDGRGLRPWRAQLRQYQHHRRELRLRPLALPAELRSGFTAAYFDQTGLYSFGRQPGALAWNLTRLAECLLPLTGLAAAEKALDAYPELAKAAFRGALLARLGLISEGIDRDARLAKAFVDFAIGSRAPFEQTLFDWRGGLASETRAKRSPSAALYEAEHFAPLREALAGYRPSATARLDHPYFAASEPCAMLIDEVEAIWSAIAERDDWNPFQAKLARIAEMRAAYVGE